MELDKETKLYSRTEFLKLFGILVASVVLLPGCDTNMTITDLENTQEAGQNKSGVNSTTVPPKNPQPTNTVKTGPQPNATDEFFMKNLSQFICGGLALVAAAISAIAYKSTIKSGKGRSK